MNIHLWVLCVCKCHSLHQMLTVDSYSMLLSDCDSGVTERHAGYPTSETIPPLFQHSWFAGCLKSFTCPVLSVQFSAVSKMRWLQIYIQICSSVGLFSQQLSYYQIVLCHTGPVHRHCCFNLALDCPEPALIPWKLGRVVSHLGDEICLASCFHPHMVSWYPGLMLSSLIGPNAIWLPL